MARIAVIEPNSNRGASDCGEEPLLSVEDDKAPLPFPHLSDIARRNGSGKCKLMILNI